MLLFNTPENRTEQSNHGFDRFQASVNELRSWFSSTSDTFQQENQENMDQIEQDAGKIVESVSHRAEEDVTSTIRSALNQIRSGVSEQSTVPKHDDDDITPADDETTHRF